MHRTIFQKLSLQVSASLLLALLFNCAQAEEESNKTWKISAEIGWQNDDNVTTSETDNNSGLSDDALQTDIGIVKIFDLNGTEIEAGYDYSKTKYNSLSSFDMTSHSLSLSGTKELESINLMGLYLYSESQLGGSDFLHLSNVYFSAGKLIDNTKWYLNPAINYQSKNFISANTRDAEQYAFDMMALHLGESSKFKFGFRLESENTTGDETDYLAKIYSASFKTPWNVGSIKSEFEIAHKFTDKNFDNETSSISTKRWDDRNQTDLKVTIPLDTNLDAKIYYTYIDAQSNLSSSDYVENIIGASLAYSF